MAAMGIGQVAHHAPAEGRVGGLPLHTLVGAPVDTCGAVVGSAGDALVVDIETFDAHRHDGQFALGGEMGCVERDGTVAEAHLRRVAAVTLRAAQLAHALADGERRIAEQGVEDKEVLGCAVGADGEREVFDIASGPTGGRRKLVFHYERAAHVGGHLVYIAVMHAVEARRCPRWWTSCIHSCDARG